MESSVFSELDFSSSQLIQNNKNIAAETHPVKEITPVIIQTVPEQIEKTSQEEADKIAAQMLKNYPKY